MTAFDTQLWARLERYRIGPEDASLSFADRLARENRWSAAFARRVIQEYYRFCYLAMTVGHDVTPSDQVDQAWHLHLTYSRDYWQRFCPEVLRANLHHGPTAGGQLERSRYYEQYAQTLADYEGAFGEPAPNDIWPPAARRFGPDPMSYRVNPSEVISLPRNRVGLILAVMGLVAILAFLAGRSL